jgi:DegV family protein with EDD domain
LEYLKKGGRLTPAVAAIGSLLKIKPVLSIYGEKLDKYSMARTVKAAKQTMIDALKKDMKDVLHTDNLDEVVISVAHTQNQEAAEKFREELLEEFPGKEIWIDPLSLSVSCHIGPGALACTVTKKLIDIE